jgi:hypothetical protein
MDDRDEVLPRQLAAWTVLGGVLVAVLIVVSVRCAAGPPGPPPAAFRASRSLPPEPEPVLIAADEPDSDYYPCSDCHEDEPTDRMVRTLEYEHEDLELAHGDLWCLHCHEADDRDVLHLADEKTVDYGESWRLCTQCHGEKLADWRAGVHGKREGHWWGPKQYRTCVSCHRPHTPAFAPLEPEPPPLPPGRIVRHAGIAPMEGAHE